MHCNLTEAESARVVPDLLARLSEFEAAVGFPRLGVLALVSGRYDVAADIFHAAAGEALRELAREGERRYLVYLAAANGARLLALGAEISVTVHVLDVAQLRDAARALAAHGLRVHYHARRRDGGRVCGTISPALLPALARVGGCRVQLS